MVFTDRFVEHLLIDALTPVIGVDAAVHEVARGCTSTPCHLVSTDNEDAPTYKFELPIEQAIASSLAGHTMSFDYLANIGGARTAFLRAATEAADELTAAQGGNAAVWDEPVETGAFSAQGALSVPALDPLPNRGSYGQVVEALSPAPTTIIRTTRPDTGRPTVQPPERGLAATGAGAGLALTGLCCCAAAILLTSRAIRRTGRRWPGRRARRP